MKNWKTTLAGVVVAVVGFATYTQVDEIFINANNITL